MARKKTSRTRDGNCRPPISKNPKSLLVKKKKRRPKKLAVDDGPNLKGHLAQIAGKVDHNLSEGKVWRHTEGEKLHCELFDGEGGRISRDRRFPIRTFTSE